MAVSLSKGGNVSLTKEAPGLTAVTVGLGWDVRSTTGTDFDLDASAIAVNPAGKVYSDGHFVFFNNKQTPDQTIVHTGDNRTGEGAGDDEAITVHLGGLPPEVTGLVFVVNSFSGQKFSDVAKAYCRLLDAQSGEELVRFDLTHSEPRTGVMMAKLIRQFSGEWEMTALGEYVDARTVRGMVKPAGKAL